MKGGLLLAIMLRAGAFDFWFNIAIEELFLGAWSLQMTRLSGMLIDFSTPSNDSHIAVDCRLLVSFALRHASHQHRLVVAFAKTGDR